MAQITWRNIDAPQLSTRDLALASAGITNSFDRLGQTLFDREARLRTEATDAAATQVLLAKSAEEAQAAAQAALNSGNRRVNARSVAELLTPQIAALQQREVAADQLLGIRAHNQFGANMTELQRAQFNNDQTALAALQQRLSSSAEGQRWLADSADEGFTAFTAGDVSRHNTEDRAETARGHTLSYKANMASVGVQRERLNMERAALARQEQERRAREQAGFFGQDWATQNVARDPKSSIIALQSTPEYKSATPELKRAMETGFLGAHQAGLRLSPEERGFIRDGEKYSDVGRVSGFAKLVGDEVNRRNQALETQLRSKDPAMDIALRAEKHKNATAEQAIEYLDGLNGLGWGEAQYVRNVLARHPGLTPAMVMAAADRVGSTVTAGGLIAELDGLFAPAVEYQDQGGATLARNVLNQANAVRNQEAQQAQALAERAARLRKAGRDDEAAELVREARQMYYNYYPSAAPKTTRPRGK